MLNAPSTWNHLPLNASVNQALLEMGTIALVSFFINDNGFIFWATPRSKPLLCDWALGFASLLSVVV